MNDTTGWTIVPNQGVLPIAFGATQKEVAQIDQLGPVVRVLPGQAEVVTEMRALEHPTVSYREGGAFYIAVGHQAENVRFADIDVFKTDPRSVLQAFETANGQPGFVQLGRVVFEALNISLEGFYLLPEDAYFDPIGEDQDDRVIVLHAPGTIKVFDNLPKTTVSFH